MSISLGRSGNWAGMTRRVHGSASWDPVTLWVTCGRKTCACCPGCFLSFPFGWTLCQMACCRSPSSLSGSTLESLACCGASLQWRFTWWWALVSPWRSCNFGLLINLLVAAREKCTPSNSKYPSFTVPSWRWNDESLSTNSTQSPSHATFRPAFNVSHQPTYIKKTRLLRWYSHKWLCSYFFVFLLLKFAAVSNSKP